MSISSINNNSKHSFEELEKNEVQTTNNYYLNKTPRDASTKQEDSNAFCFINQNSQQDPNSSQKIPELKSDISPGQVQNIGSAFEIDRSIGKEENFEEIMESKDIIEDRVLRLKHMMIEYTIK